jgi:hypothetical protein
MNKRQENKLTMYEGLLVLLQNHTGKTQSVGGFAESVTELAAIVSDIKTKSVEVDIATVGKVAAKCSAQEALVAALLPFCAVLHVLGRKQNNAEIQGRTNVSESRLNAMRDTELASYATALIDLASANLQGITPNGIGQERIDDLKSKTDAYAMTIGVHEASVAERIGARGRMSEMFDNADDLLREELDRYMELLRPTEVEFYNKYFSARLVRDTGVRHRNGDAAAIPATAAATAPVARTGA